MFRLILSLALLMSCGANRAPAQTQSHVDRTTIEAFVDGAVREALRADHIAGVSIAIVDRAGVVMARGYGAAAFDPYRKADADTLFRVGSISKTPVWIAIMQLVEQGKLSLDDPINNRLPPSLQVPDEGFQKPILVRHLMTHTAGFEDSTEGLFVHDPTKLMTLDQSLAAYRVHRVREPGTLAVYSNYGAALAGALVAHVAGETWQDYAERRILRPLGLATATYREPYPESVATARDPRPEPMAAEVLAKRRRMGFSWSSGAYHTQPFEYVSDDAPAGNAGSASAPTIWPSTCRRCSTPSSWPMRVCLRSRRSARSCASSFIRKHARAWGDAARILRPGASEVAAALASVMAERLRLSGDRQWRSIPTKASRFSISANDAPVGGTLPRTSLPALLLDLPPTP